MYSRHYARILCLSLLFVGALSPADAGAQMDIDWICITCAKDHRDGVPVSATPWFFEIWIHFVDLGTLHHTDVTKPGDSVPFATIYGDGDYDTDTVYTSLASLRLDYPLGTYTFEFREAGGALLKTVNLDYSGLPAEPQQTVDFTHPAADGETGVSVNPTFAWTVNTESGDALMMGLEGDGGIGAGPVSMDSTTWAPGPLASNHLYNLEVSVCTVKDWIGPDWPTMTVGGDQFKCTLMTEYLNEISFTTVDCRAVHRFWSPSRARHFYTTSESEKQKLIDNYPHVWTYEGTAYYALPDGSEPGSAPVHRFWSDKSGAHFYTISDTEKQKLLDQYSHVLTYEGPAFYAYPDGQQPAGTSPVYRFWSASKGCHFYTISESEKDKLISTYPHVWTYESVAWHAYQ